jgi:hypothetical protein
VGVGSTPMRPPSIRTNGVGGGIALSISSSARWDRIGQDRWTCRAAVAARQVSAISERYEQLVIDFDKVEDEVGELVGDKFLVGR